MTTLREHSGRGYGKKREGSWRGMRRVRESGLNSKRVTEKRR